jgi:hypothetical protein
MLEGFAVVPGIAGLAQAKHSAWQDWPRRNIPHSPPSAACGKRWCNISNGAVGCRQPGAELLTSGELRATMHEMRMHLQTRRCSRSKRNENAQGKGGSNDTA